MSLARYESAYDRLVRAVERLEGAAESARDRLAQDPASEKLAADLRIARADHKALLAVTGNVADRLDDTIARVRELLGDDEPSPPEAGDAPTAPSGSP